MKPTTLEELGRLHDCDVTSIAYDISRAMGRTIRLTMTCPSDFGYPEQNGRTLVLVAEDVAFSQHATVYVAAPETIDALVPGVSPQLVELGAESRRRGASRFPAVEFTVVFNTGSSLEVVCRSLQVEIST